jgi:hypothetical protein
MLEATPSRVVPILAIAVALSVGGVGLAQADSHLSAQAAKKGKKKRHTLNADYKSGPLGIIDESANTLTSEDESRLVGQPFGAKKAHLEEVSVLTFTNPGTDYSGTYHFNFKAVVYGHHGGGFRGFYDYSVDANGNQSTPVTGTITGGSGTYRGATGSFVVTDLTPFHLENVQYRGHWQGSMRY